MISYHYVPVRSFKNRAMLTPELLVYTINAHVKYHVPPVLNDVDAKQLPVRVGLIHRLPASLHPTCLRVTAQHVYNRLDVTIESEKRIDHLLEVDTSKSHFKGHVLKINLPST